jgi:hypothetical protein
MSRNATAVSVLATTEAGVSPEAIAQKRHPVTRHNLSPTSVK